MKKIIVLMTSLLLLTGCVKVSFTGPKKEEKTSQSTSSKKEPLTFVRADQYKDQDNEVLEASEKFIKEHPTLGEPGKLFVFFPGYTFGNEENRFARLAGEARPSSRSGRLASLLRHRRESVPASWWCI